MTLGRELFVGLGRLDTLEVKADANDAILVTKQPGGFVQGHLMEGGSYLQVDAADDDTAFNGLRRNFRFNHGVSWTRKNGRRCLQRLDGFQAKCLGWINFPNWNYCLGCASSSSMNRLTFLVALLFVPLLHAQDAFTDFEKQIGALVAGPQVTVVHFWAPWCPNCKAEMAPDGWAKFIGENPKVQVVFINVWHKAEDPAPKLAAAGLGAQPNLRLLTHPNPSRIAADRVNIFLGLPLTWLPSTWIYRDGKLRVAFNYGEIRFPVLQQMIDDASNKWAH
jgi:thiol-disulfide isomerase/thioredoxin